MKKFQGKQKTETAASPTAEADSPAISDSTTTTTVPVAEESTVKEESLLPPPLQEPLKEEKEQTETVDREEAPQHTSDELNMLKEQLERLKLEKTSLVRCQIL